MSRSKKINVLVATKLTQGQRKNDFFWATEGELVRFHSECDGESINGHCGCRRSMSGLKSLKATTTMQVAEMDMDEKEYEIKIAQSLKASWGKSLSPQELNTWAHRDAVELLRMGKFWPVGTVVEKRGNTYKARRLCMKP